MAGKVDGWDWRFSNPHGKFWIVNLKAGATSHADVPVAWDVDWKAGKPPSIVIHFEREADGRAALTRDSLLIGLARKDIVRGEVRARVLQGVYVVRPIRESSAPPRGNAKITIEAEVVERKTA